MAQGAGTPRVVELAGIQSGQAFVSVDGHAIRARRIASVTLEALRTAASLEQDVVVLPGRDKDPRPVIIGIVADATSSEAELETAPPASAAAGTTELVAQLDGKRVVLKAEDEIVLECGEASITLRRNGRVVIRGAYVETRSRGVNRIKGGTVRIN